MIVSAARLRTGPGDSKLKSVEETERGVAVTLLVSYSGEARFDYPLGHRLPLLRFSWFFLVHSGKFWNGTSVWPEPFFPNPFHLNIHESYCHSKVCIPGIKFT
jgi:hypothetical protein